MSSLKLFLPSLEQPLMTDAVTLYERQRVLVKDGVLRASAGRGPGSGVRLTANNLAILLISVLASDTLADTGSITPLFINLTPSGGKCPMTKAENLGDAVAAALASKKILDAVGDLIIHREGKRATFLDASKESGHLFLDRRFRHPVHGLDTRVRLPKRVLAMISTAFIKLTDS